jgi:hypothetical protein
MKKSLYLGGEKPSKEYYAKDFSIYFRQLLKSLVFWRKKK